MSIIIIYVYKCLKYCLLMFDSVDKWYVRVYNVLVNERGRFVKKKKEINTMTKEEVSMIGFEIVAYSGDARSKLLLAVEKAKQKDFTECDKLISEANDCLNDAHKSQTELLQLEARGENIDIGFITVHAQDHLMTTILLKDIINNLLDIYR